MGVYVIHVCVWVYGCVQNPDCTSLKTTMATHFKTGCHSYDKPISKGGI